jgi:hypothetical protein
MIARNRSIFHNEYLLVARVVVNSIGIMDSLYCSGGVDLAQPRTVRNKSLTTPSCGGISTGQLQLIIFCVEGVVASIYQVHIFTHSKRVCGQPQTITHN